MPTVQVVRTYLEMLSPEDLRGAPEPTEPLRLERVQRCPVSFFRYLYVEVGRAHHWVDRLSWSDERVRAHLNDPDVSLWLLSTGGAPAGYFELRRHADRSVEVAYFGLLPEFLGRGWGGHLLTLAVRTAWSLAPERVWLHTCTLDHPAALRTYQRVGFEPYAQKRIEIDDPRLTGEIPMHFEPNLP